MARSHFHNAEGATTIPLCLLSSLVYLHCWSINASPTRTPEGDVWHLHKHKIRIDPNTTIRIGRIHAEILFIPSVRDPQTFLVYVSFT